MRFAWAVPILCLSTACSRGNHPIAVSLPAGVGERAVAVEVRLLRSCDDVTNALGRVTVRPGEASTTTFGVIAQGSYAIWGRAVDASCHVVAEGCVPVTVGAGAETIEVTLAAADRACVAADACACGGPDGSVDAGTDDAGTDDANVDAWVDPCTIGWTSCDGPDAVCETDTTSDRRACGTCTHACDPGQGCEDGRCTPDVGALALIGDDAAGSRTGRAMAVVPASTTLVIAGTFRGAAFPGGTGRTGPAVGDDGFLARFVPLDGTNYAHEGLGGFPFRLGQDGQADELRGIAWGDPIAVVGSVDDPTGFASGCTGAVGFPAVGTIDATLFTVRATPTTACAEEGVSFGFGYTDTAAAITRSDDGDFFVGGELNVPGTADRPLLGGFVPPKNDYNPFVARVLPDLGAPSAEWINILAASGDDVTTFFDEASSVALVPSRNRVCAAGTYADEDADTSDATVRWSIDPGGMPMTPRGAHDGFVACFAVSDGAVAFTETLGGAGEDAAHGVSALPSGDALFVVGTYASAATLGTFPLTSRGGHDGFIARIDAATGAVVAARSLGTPGEDAMTAVVTTDDTAYAVLNFVAGAGTSPDFGDAELTALGVDAILPAGTSNGALVLAYRTSDLGLRWARYVSDAELFAIATDAGHVFATGHGLGSEVVLDRIARTSATTRALVIVRLDEATP